MKIAVLSDIHGNSDALEAVLDEISREGITKLFLLGDFVGYYYHPDKVMNLLSGWDKKSIKGNHEDILAALIDGTAEAATIRPKYGSGHQSAVEKLNSEQIADLINAPASLSVQIDGFSISLNHGASFDQSVYLYPDTDKKILERCDNGSDFIFIGHSHYPFIYKTKNAILVNAGSVGQSRLKGGEASWCVLNTENGIVEMKATSYDTTALIKEAEAKDPATPYLSEILKRNNTANLL